MYNDNRIGPKTNLLDAVLDRSEKRHADTDRNTTYFSAGMK